MKKSNPKIIRNNRGLSIILLVVVLAIVQLTIDFFVFNLVRILMVQRQLTGVCEAASLDGTSLLAKLDVSSDSRDQKKLAQAQKAACRCAENMVLRGHILGKVINKAVRVDELSDLGKGLKPDSCQYKVVVADPAANYAAVPFGNVNGKTISCYIAYGYSPVFLGFLGNTCYTITSNCVSGLPQIDSVVVLDLSASMDDQTAVTFVRREWIHSPLGMGNFAMGNLSRGNFNSGPCGIIQYVSLYCPSTPHTLANYLGWNAEASSGTENDESEVIDGSLVNVLPPQNLDKANNEPHGAITHPMFFDAYLRSHYSHYAGSSNYASWEATPSPYCRALDYGTPPGNCDLSVGLGGNGDAATDMMGNPATPVGPGPNWQAAPGTTPSPINRGPIITVTTSPVPAINAFGDLTWQNDGSNYFGYQPAAPGARQGVAHNDFLPSPDQQTFTDLVVNIVNPDTASRARVTASSDQPLIGPDYFVGFSYTFPSDDPDLLLRNQTFNFPNIAVVVEAARGNLESTPVLPSGVTNAQAALIDRPVSVDGVIFNMTDIQLKDGYQRAYQRLAMMVTQPLASVLTAIDQGYFQKLHKFADCRFGLVSFSSAGSLTNDAAHMCTLGTLNDKSAQSPQASSFYIFCNPSQNPSFSNPVYDCGAPTSGGLNDYAVQDGTGFGFRIPRMPLDANNEQYLECISKNKIKEGELNIRLNTGSGANGIYNCRPESTTDSGEALQAAHHMFHSGKYTLDDSNKCRRASSKLIVFFTDGEPTGGFKSKEAQAMLNIAGTGTDSHFGSTCEADGIAIFTISLNLNKGKAHDKLKEHQLTLLNDKRPEINGPAGIAWRAGHGSRYYACDNLAQLSPSLFDIARRFSQSQR